MNFGLLIIVWVHIGESDDGADDLSDVEETMSRIRGSNDQNNTELFRIIDARKKFYISKIRPFQETISSGHRIQVLQTYIDYGSAELISQFLASKRSFSQSFDCYLRTVNFVIGHVLHCEMFTSSVFSYRFCLCCVKVLLQFELKQ